MHYQVIEDQRHIAKPKLTTLLFRGSLAQYNAGKRFAAELANASNPTQELIDREIYRYIALRSGSTNSYFNNVGRAVKYAGHAAFAADAYSTHCTIQSVPAETRDKVATVEIARFTGAAGGSIVYSAVGTSIGGAIGTAIFPGIGTAVGAFVGGFAGGWIGAQVFGDAAALAAEDLTGLTSMKMKSIYSAEAQIPRLKEKDVPNLLQQQRIEFMPIQKLTTERNLNIDRNWRRTTLTGQ